MAWSKPGSRLPSPTLKVAGFLSKVLSTTSPFSSLMAKCRVTSLSGPIRTSVMGFFSGLLAFEHIQRQQNRAAGNRHIGDIERREIPAVLPVQQNKVDHMAKHHAIDQVTQRAAQHQGQSHCQPGLAWLEALEPDHQHRADRYGNGREEPALPAGRIGEKAEGCARSEERRV